MPQPSIVHHISTLATVFLIHSTITHNNNNNLSQFLCTAQLLPDEPEHNDYYCGYNWEEANADCAYHCPSGLDGDCPPLPNGRKRRCIAAAGCFVRFRKVYWTGLISLSFDKEEHLANTNDVAASTTESTEEEALSLVLMTKEEMKAFESSFQQHLFGALEEQLQLQMSVREQVYDRPCVGIVSGVDPTSTTSLDMLVRVVGDYIPIGDRFFTDDTFGEQILALVNDQPEPFVNAIRNNNSPSSSFFNAVTGISGIEEDGVGESPSAMPSAPPSRGFDQTFDIRIDPRATGANGIVFNVRTPRCGQTPNHNTCGTLLLTGMSFVTSHEDKLEYLVYSKLGPYEKFVGKPDNWDLVASGQTRGRGIKQYTRVLEYDTAVTDESGLTLNYVGFRPLHVPGDRAQRSFYITLTWKFAKDERSPIPIMFSYPIVDENEGERRYEVVASTPEFEVYEGEGVLDHPWPSDRDGPYYRRPRGFIGSFDYERYPCHPLLNFTGWPCPYRRRTKRPTARPTGRPTNPPFTQQPTKDPTNAPTLAPVVQTNAADEPDTDVRESMSSGAEAETNATNEDSDAVGAQEEETRNEAILSWKVAYRRCRCGLALLLMYFS
mmetsp:Transcript_13501/g.24419  ORF Transcript_13501/g.24419 Transcript_13501/m.24419 type:complete len:606 (+) Transcript_13501:77-1894(+)